MILLHGIQIARKAPQEKEAPQTHSGLTDNHIKAYQRPTSSKRFPSHPRRPIFSPPPAPPTTTRPILLTFHLPKKSHTPSWASSTTSTPTISSRQPPIQWSAVLSPEPLAGALTVSNQPVHHHHPTPFSPPHRQLATLEKRWAVWQRTQRWESEWWGWPHCWL